MPEESGSERPRRRRLALSGVLLLIALLALLIVITWARSRRTAREEQELSQEQSRGPRVNVARVARSPGTREIELIGEARPFLSNALYARVSGYLTGISVDKGDRVAAGEVLANIESPETDKAYLSALADATNKERIAGRERALLRKKLVSQQEVDQAVAAADMARAALEVQRVLRGYETVRAPFAGTITARYVDPGALIQNASGSQASAQVLLTLSQTDRLRIYAYVEQKDASYVHPGDEAEITLPYVTGFRLIDKVARISGELDPKTRTLLTEIDVDNSQGRIVSGSFVHVKLRLPVPASLEIPVKAVVMRGNRPFAPVIRSDRTLHFQEVALGANDGQNVQVLSGLSEGETVALDVGSSITEGRKVQPQQLAGQAGPKAP